MLIGRRARRWSTLAVSMTLAGMVGALPVGTADEALAQDDQNCWEQQWVIVGYDENGDPTFEWRLVNICESEGGGGGSGGGPNTCEHPTYGEFPCFDQQRGWWTGLRDGCYASLLSPQPGAGDPRWGGGDPGEGSLYILSCPRDVSGTGDFAESYVVLDEAPGGPSIAQLAQQAMDNLPLAEPDIGIAPSPDGVGLVGLHVWMWVENADAALGPVDTTVGPVFAQAQATQVEWNMGDGTRKVCEGSGTPYEPRYGDGPSPSGCDHVYTEPSRDQPGGRYTVTATVSWHIEWWVQPQGSGAEGEDFQSRTSETSVRINELQVVTS